MGGDGEDFRLYFVVVAVYSLGVVLLLFNVGWSAVALLLCCLLLLLVLLLLFTSLRCLTCFRVTGRIKTCLAPFTDKILLLF